MSKGLEAWKRLTEHNSNDESYWYGKQFDKDKEIIEEELKAIEIIKDTLGIRLFETNKDNTLGETHCYIDIGGLVSYQLKSREQYDLLKEVLL